LDKTQAEADGLETMETGPDPLPRTGCSGCTARASRLGSSGKESVADVQNTGGKRGSEQRLLAEAGAGEHWSAIPATACDLTNRRMRTRMSGGVRGGRLAAAPLLDWGRYRRLHRRPAPRPASMPRQRNRRPRPCRGRRPSPRSCRDRRTATSTPLPATATATQPAVGATATAPQPTNTPIPPTATPQPTNTPIPAPGHANADADLDTAGHHRLAG
jgi:hypothetical protein